MKLLIANSYNKRSQDLYDTYHDAGQFYWANEKTWLNESIIFNKKSKIVEINYLNYMDINYPEDFKLAKKLYKLNI